MSPVPSTITGDFPPNSRVTADKFLDAASITIFPTLGLPVKCMWLKGSFKSSVDSLTEPSITATSFSS